MAARKKAAEPTGLTKARGATSSCTPELAERICGRLAMGHTLRSVCSEKGMPRAHTVIGWTLVNPAFREHYVRAREIGYLQMADGILDIADDGSNDYVERLRADGSKVVLFDGEHVQRSRLRVDTRKWLMSKALPKLYGDKLELSGPGGGPIQNSQTIAIADLAPEQREQLRAILLSTKRPAMITDVEAEEVEE